MKRFRKVLLTVPLVVCGSSAFGDTLTIDLARQAPGSAVTLPAGAFPEITIHIVNRVPRLPYSTSVEDSITRIPEWTPLAASGREVRNPCGVLLAKAEGLSNAGDEETVRRGVAEIHAGIDQCTDQASLREISGHVALTTLDVPGVYRVQPGHQLTITVSRDADADAKAKLTWVTIVKGEDRGMWLTTYGAVVTPDKDERFFSQPGADGKYTISPEAEATGVKMIPSVFFTWLPRAHQTQTFSWGLTGGLGVKSDTPAFFVGGSLTYNWNLGLVAGVSLVKETRLDGKYTSHQTISENLGEDQLLKTVFQPRAFVGVTFRFGSNPFESKGGSTNAAAPAATQKSGKKDGR